MAEPGPRRGRPRDPAVDEAVLAAAMELLADAGFARLTMEQVAARAGVGKASVYLRWPNKVTLLAEAIQHHVGVVPDVPDTGTLAGDMRTFLRALLRTFGAASRAMSAVSGEVDRHPELRAAWRQSVAAALTDCVREIVERAVRRGELPADSVVGRIVNQFYTPA